MALLSKKVCNRIFVMLCILIVNLLLANLGCTQVIPSNSVTTIPVTIPAVTGSPAPNFSLKDIEGNTINLSEILDKTVMLSFWSIT